MSDVIATPAPNATGHYPISEAGSAGTLTYCASDGQAWPCETAAPTEAADGGTATGDPGDVAATAPDSAPAAPDASAEASAPEPPDAPVSDAPPAGEEPSA